MKLKPADTAFSNYVRQRDSIDGWCKCPLCPNAAPWQAMVCGHYIKRGHKTTRWHPDNAHAICPECNGKMERDNNLIIKCGLWIVNKIGSQRWADLMIAKLSGYKYMQHEIDGFETKYKDRIKKL